MDRSKDVAGDTFSRLTVIERTANNSRGEAKWLCRCSCGTFVTAVGHHLRAGLTKSCGCLNREAVSNAARRHGASHTPQYKAWHSMVSRCSNPRHHKWDRYGGRGISVCARWTDYANFLQDMGPRPPHASIDRIDNDGDYEPDNCRWSTPLEQASNRSNNQIVSVNGLTMTASQASRNLGPSRSTVSRRIRDGWPPETAASTPLNQPRGNR